jgi:hypothetical protein
MFEEVPLAIDDRLRYPQYSFEALLNILDKPLGLLQLGGELLCARVPIALQNLRTSS